MDDKYHLNNVISYLQQLADGMYDSNNNFRYLSKKRTKPGIKTRSNSKVKSTTNCPARNMSVIRQQTNLKRWRHSVSYGHRWIAETVFSSIREHSVNM